MNVITRGVRNAFRNGIRTASVVLILGLAIGLSLTMLVARQAVQQKINTVKSSIGNTITIAPAGYSGFSSVNNALTSSQLAKVAALPHVSGVAENLTDRLSTIGSSQPSFGPGGGNSSAASSNNQTSLKSPIKININASGSGSGGPSFHVFVSGGGSLPTNFSPPISIIGTNTPTSVNGSSLTIAGGTAIASSSNTNDAMISASMASKNGLKVGSTFTAYGKTLTVAAIFKTSDQSVAGTVIVSLPTEQRLSGQSGDVTSAVATVDSLSNLSSATSAIKNKLGSAADVTSAEAQANQTLQPLNSVKSIALFSLIGAVVAGAIIILLVMIMIVRERRREIGVLKAIGASNLRVALQFMTEAITLTILGAVIGLIIGVVGGNPVTKLLVNNTSTSTSQTQSAGAVQRGGDQFAGNFGGGAGGTQSARPSQAAGHGGFGRQFTSSGVVGSSLKNIHASVGWSILLYGFVAALVIAIVGSALASILIAKVRPAEVMRVE